jgi:hypothetical protein
LPAEPEGRAGDETRTRDINLGKVARCYGKTLLAAKMLPTFWPMNKKAWARITRTENHGKVVFVVSEQHRVGYSN